MPAYTVTKNGRYWSVLCDGLPMSRHQYCNRKRDALAAIQEIIVAEEYERLCIEQDTAGTYVWTPEEEKQIEEYAVLLQANAERWTFYGKATIQDIGRKQQSKDLETINGPRERWTDPDGYFREKRREMTARAEAFRRAGATIYTGLGQA